MSGPSESEIVRRLREGDGRDSAPPAALLRRITAELPPSVAVHPAVVEATRPSRPPLWRSWLIAASLVATLGGGLVALRVMQRMTAPPETVAAHPAPVGRATPPAPDLPGPGASPSGPPAPSLAAPPKEDGRDRTAEARPSAPPETRAAAPPPVAVGAAPPAMEPLLQPAPSTPAAPPALRREARDEVAERQDAVPTGAGGASREPEKSRTEATYATAPESAPPVAAAAAPRAKSATAAPARPQPAAAAGGTLQGGSEEASAPRDGGSALAERLEGRASAAVAPSVATSADVAASASYATARRMLQSGQLPPAASVRTADFVRAFTVAGDGRGEPGFALAAEGAPSPFEADGRMRLLRLSVGIGDDETGQAPSAAEARVVFDRSIVATHRLLGVTGTPSGSLLALRAGDRVVALYEIELQPGVRPAAVPRRLASLELRYGAAGAGGAERGGERSFPVPASAFVSAWSQASPALRLEALAAQLADILVRHSPAERLPALLARARELAPTVRGTPRAGKLDELIDLIGRTARLMGTGR